MLAYRLETVVPEDGHLQLMSLPFLPGAAIEIIILARNPDHALETQFPLKNTVLKYDDPTEPVADMDWSVLQ